MIQAEYIIVFSRAQHSRTLYHKVPGNFEDIAMPCHSNLINASCVEHHETEFVKLLYLSIPSCSLQDSVLPLLSSQRLSLMVEFIPTLLEIKSTKGEQAI